MTMLKKEATPIAALLAQKVALAPMAGITDAPLRAQVRRHGLAYAVAEMVNGDWLASGRAEGRNRVRRSDDGFHIVQLAACDCADLTLGVRLAEEEGADLIDLNMGCPAKRVTGGLAGAALMRDLDQAERLIATAVGAASRPVSVKMRLGWDETSHNASDLARRAEAAGAAMIIVHGRTRQQFYKGRADWAAVRAVREATRLPLVVNGDIVCGSSARAALALSGADAVMIGRGVQGRPYLPAMVAAALAETAYQPPDRSARLEEACALYEAHLSLYGQRVGLRIARKHVGWALEAWAADHRVPTGWLPHWRARLLTLEEPASVLAGLKSAAEALSHD